MARPFLGSLPARRVATLALFGVVGAGVLAACNEVPPQSREHASISGLNASFSSIGIRNAQLTLAANGNAALTLALFNSGDDDKLVDVSSTAATTAILPGSDGVDVTGAEGVFVTTGKPIVLVGLKDVLVGNDVPVKLTFQNAGSVTLQIPVATTDPSLQVGPSPTATPTSTPKP